MSESSKNLWYQLGYALETARRRASAPRKVSAEADDGHAPSSTPVRNRLLAGGGGAVAHRLVSGLADSRPGTLRTARAALAGAGAGFLLSLLRSDPEPSSMQTKGAGPDPVTELLKGAGRGICYGSLLKLHLPGPPMVRGAACGIIEYVTVPLGGLDSVLGAASPQSITSLLALLSAAEEVPAGSLADHVAFGAAFGLFYGEGGERRGRRAVV